MPSALRQASPAELKARIEAEREGQPFLIVRDGSGMVPLAPERSPLRLGRSRECDVHLDSDPDPTVGTRQSFPNVPVVIHRSKSLPSLGDLERSVDGYIRVSRVGDRNGESHISPDVQRRALERWAAERGVELVLHDPEENVSGATMDRPIS